VSAACCVICPAYSGRHWPALPRLEAAARQLQALLRDHGVRVEWLAPASPEAGLRALRARARVADQLIVYVGGHGIVEAGEHFTALDDTAERADSLDSIWTRQLADVLSRSSCQDVVVFIDSCFSGQAALALGQALSVLATSPNRRGFGLIAACRAFQTADDGRFLELLLELMRQGPRANPTAWAPHDDFIRLGALVSELGAAGIAVTDVTANNASELRLLPNPLYDPAELPGRVHVKLLRRLSSGAEEHLLEKSEGFVGRWELRKRIADWLNDAAGGMFLVTGGPGTGKSALMGLLARQSVGDPSARSIEGPCLPEKSFDVIIHARQKTAEQVVAELASVADSNTASVLVDAVDEAVAGEAIGIAAHLRSLRRRPGIRLVVGSRRSPVVSTRLAGRDPLLAELYPTEEVNLDTLETTRADIEELLTILLSAPGSPYADVDVTELAAEVAQRTTPSFLFAHTAARWLSGQPRITDRPDWRDRVAGFGSDTTLGVLLDEDLAARFHGNNLPRVRDLLRALAWAEGLGMPRYTIWPEFARALSPADAAYGDPDVTWVLNEAGWYITEAGEDGQTVYRLFHQALVDWFRRDTLRD
jgi:hypothetical protein